MSLHISILALARRREVLSPGDAQSYSRQPVSANACTASIQAPARARAPAVAVVSQQRCFGDERDDIDPDREYTRDALTWML
jgi:hypothetical protein